MTITLESHLRADPTKHPNTWQAFWVLFEHIPFSHLMLWWQEWEAWEGVAQCLNHAHADIHPGPCSWKRGKEGIWVPYKPDLREQILCRGEQKSPQESLSLSQAKAKGRHTKKRLSPLPVLGGNNWVWQWLLQNDFLGHSRQKFSFILRSCHTYIYIYLLRQLWM